jgi:hypothetical protein
LSIFGQIHGLPLHPLVVHATVVAAPLAGLVGVAHLVPKWRNLLRWPLVVISVVALLTVFLARETGQVLRRVLASQLKGTITGHLVARHAQLAGRLLLILLVLAVLTIAAALLHHVVRSVWVGHVAAVIVAVVAVGALVLTYQTGDAGAKAAWNPAGSVDYSGN